jgi:hypothetical protein
MSRWTPTQEEGLHDPGAIFSVCEEGRDAIAAPLAICVRVKQLNLQKK